MIRTIWNQDADLSYMIDDIMSEHPEISEERALEVAKDYHMSYLEDEKLTLDIDVDGCIVCFADLGFWYGRRQRCRKIGDNISEILEPQLHNSLCHWYVEGGDLHGSESHHDSTHYYTFRLVSEEDWENFLYGDISFDDLKDKSTSLADKVNSAYGWN